MSGAIVVLGGLAAHAQVDSTALRFAATITSDELREHLTVLASDAYLGRDTGKEGQKMAAAYLKKEFMAMGIPPVPAPDPKVITEGYFQPFELIEDRSGSISIDGADRSLTFLKDLLYFSEHLKADRAVKEVVYMRDGSTLADAKDLQGNVVIVEDPGNEDVAELIALRMRNEAAGKAGAEVVLVPTQRLALLTEQLGHYATASHMRLADATPKESGKPAPQLILIDARAMDALLGKKNTLARLKRKPAGRKVAVDFTLRKGPSENRLVSENVLAFIEGTDKKDEIVVITAHYDHVGVENGVVYNGADDDGTGTVAIMEIAEAFAQAKAAGHGPRRSILVMPVSGEEKGLLGSRYYSDHPVFPLENTVADLNIDMIGRRDSAHTTGAPYVYVIGSDRLSTDLHAANERANTTYAHLALDYTFNAENDPNRFYYRSDHYNFARKGVPSIFYFSGVHEDYHKPGDDVEKILFDLLHQRTLLVFHTAWILANADQRPVVDKAAKP